MPRSSFFAEPVTETVNVTEARRGWSDLLNRVFRREARVIVEKSGMPVLTGEAFAILSLLVMVIVAFAILRRVTDTPRDWKALGNQSAAGATLQPAGATGGPLLE
jgi:hypothetical protein